MMTEMTRYYSESPCPDCGRFEAHDDHGWTGPLRRELIDVEIVESNHLGGVDFVFNQEGTYAIIPLPPEADE